MKPLFLCLVFVCMAAAAAPAHRHGEAELEITLEGESLEIALVSPLESLVGFERAPRDEAERRRLALMADVLREGARMFAVSEAARCTLAAVRLESPLLEGRATEGGHAELVAHYRLQCKQPALLRELRTGVFEAFPRLSKIRLQFAGPQGQHAAILSRKKPRFAW